MTIDERRIGSDSAAGVPEPGWFARTTAFWTNLISGVLGRFRDENLQLQSTSLAYTTLLSLVPFLAVTFSVLKGFGVQDQLEPVLMQSLAPLGHKGVEIGQSVLSYVNNLNFAVLGFFGIAMLFWTVISLLTKVEEAFNAIWHVPDVRSWGRRFSDYLSVALVGPVFIFAALGVATVALRDANVNPMVGIEPLGKLFMMLGRLIPYLLVCAAFTFLYSFLTNYHVRLLPALAGGVFASVAWYGGGYLFANLIASSSKYSTIYSSLAAAVLFIIWVNVGWLIILVGAHIARYFQYPHLLKFDTGGVSSGQRHDEALALNVMNLIGRAYQFGETEWTPESLAVQGCCGSPDEVEALLELLTQRRLIVATKGEPEGLLPGRSIESISLQEIVAAVRVRGDEALRLSAVRDIVERVDGAVFRSLEGMTLKDLVLADSEQSAATGVDRAEALAEPSR